ncbi:MAG: hypothetical protein COV44_01565 [Deltaproteobacteria bacterium CG11_big_fil_rev_8_21_14_0_20_45_16]|nr:MAG: hypothetical protein COV44_01565 [Deltaproteobacteria bacterium CG11_big_fil_rev_8_21_14_0_20_45_16]
MNNRVLYAILILIFGSGACTASKTANLEESVNDFFTAMRREDKNAALSFVGPEKRTEFFKNSEQLEAIHFSNIRVDTIYPDETQEKALVTVVMEYFSPKSMNLTSAKRFFNWEYDSKNKVWYVIEAHPLGSGPQLKSK